ncbi:PREDICTED: F-box protein At3g07870-like [Tarenaya hassleriana]|nr:PREDICTED: F-box protein At3g07870-like [Tarenaya hassleriana]
MSLRLDRSDFEIFLRPDSPMRGSRDLHFVDLHGLCDSAPLRGGTTDVRFRVSLPKRRLDMKTPLAAERDYDIANSCNGFMCLRKATMFSSCKNPCIVWNPFTGEFTFIPKPEKENTIKAWPIVSGLGCGARSNVYKVVRLFHGVSPLSPFDRVAEVCTLGSDSWRSIGQAPWDTIYEGSTYTVYLNGVIHWLSEPDGSVAKFSLLCFGFEEEKFNHLPLPPQLLERMGDGPAESKVTLGALRGCLCVSGLVLHRIKVWILRDRSDETSWTPQFSIYNFMGSFFRPLKWLENGSLVMLWSKMSLVFYDRMARTVREFRVRGGGSVAFQAIAHVPNMGSLRDIAGGRNLVVHNGEPIRWRPEDAEAMSLVEDRDVGVNWVFDLWG